MGAKEYYEIIFYYSMHRLRKLSACKKLTIFFEVFYYIFLLAVCLLLFFFFVFVARIPGATWLGVLVGLLFGLFFIMLFSGVIKRRIFYGKLGDVVDRGPRGVPISYESFCLARFILDFLFFRKRVAFGINKHGVYALECGFVKWDEISDFKIVEAGAEKKRCLFFILKDSKKFIDANFSFYQRYVFNRAAISSKIGIPNSIPAVCEFYIKESLEDVLGDILWYKERLSQ